MKKSLFFVLISAVLVLSSQAFAGYSAIAYNSSTGAWGEGHGYDDANDAMNAAVAACGGGCVALAWAQNGCVALVAAGGNSSLYGYSWGYDDSDDAVNAAEASCDTQLSSGQCNWLVWACN